MRLRNKPWAVKLVSDHPEAVLQDPDPEQPIAWNSRFSHPELSVLNSRCPVGRKIC